MKVEKGIPIPRKFPFADMEVGDSFLVPAHVKRNNVSISALRYCRQDATGKRFTTKKTPEGLRCWRVA